MRAQPSIILCRATYRFVYLLRRRSAGWIQRRISTVLSRFGALTLAVSGRIIHVVSCIANSVNLQMARSLYFSSQKNATLSWVLQKCSTKVPSVISSIATSFEIEIFACANLCIIFVSLGALIHPIFSFSSAFQQYFETVFR